MRSQNLLKVRITINQLFFLRKKEIVNRCLLKATEIEDFFAFKLVKKNIDTS